jgi:GYF domain 2
MADRSWFYASEGQQKGPYPEAQLHDLIVRGTVRADTLVWTEGMSGWQKAADIPGLVSGGSGPPSIPQSGGPVMSADSYGGGALSIDLPVWALFGRFLLLAIGYFLVIPAPWIATSFYRWMASRTEVPGRPNFAFTGQPGDIWYVFVATGLMLYAQVYDNRLELITIPVSAFFSWILLRWLAGNLSSNGQRLPIAFNGSVVTFIGWQLLMYVSFITVIGWAWVITAWMRWICRNIGGTRREVVFNGTGLEVLWRTLVMAICCAFIIPIPWMIRWYNRWYVSQFALVERGAYAEA